MAKRPKKSKKHPVEVKQPKVLFVLKERQVEVLPFKAFSEMSGITMPMLLTLTKKPGFPSRRAFGLVWIKVGAASRWLEAESRRDKPVKGWLGSRLREMLGSKDEEQDKRKCLLDALKRTGGNQTKAAEILGVHRNTVRTRMREYGIKDLR